ncbi:MAG TPA: RDD family protein [bacterium]|nr:RDD family protein [bacterium]
MEQERREVENTDLIDVSDVEPRFDDLETERGQRDEAEKMPGMQGQQEATGPTIASLKDRFSAFAIDAAFLYCIYWVMMALYRQIALSQAAGPIPAAGKHGLIFHSLFLFIAAVWFVVPEAAFSGSLGKILCRLSIRKVDGSYPSLIGILLRNILKPLDLVLFPVLLGAALMEWGGWHQRLGDHIGRTVVLRKLTSPPRQYALSLDILATASGRALAFLIDFALFAAFAFGWALLLTPDSPLTSMMLVLFFPAFAFLFFLLPEKLSGTSPGKWLLGYAVCMEDGSAIDLSSCTIRTAWRLFDTNPFGFLTCMFSLRRQRPGDCAAGTVVISAPREWRGLAGLGAIIIACAAVLYAGMGNRDSFLHDGFQVNFLPTIDASGRSTKLSDMPANLITMNFRFAGGNPESIRRPAIFQPGETLYIVFEVSGYRREDSKAWLQEDLSVNYPDDSLGLKLENINDFNQELLKEGPIRFENNIAIPEGAQPGRYTVTVTIRDRLARQELKEQRFFYVTPPETGDGAPQIKPPDEAKDEGPMPPPAVYGTGAPPNTLNPQEKIPSGESVPPSPNVADEPL